TANIQSGATENQIPLAVTIAADATPGPRSITITTPVGNATASAVFTVQHANVPVTMPLPISDVETGDIRTGYVIITPDANSAAPLTTATFGMINLGSVQSQAGMFPSPLTTDATLFVESIPGIGRSLGLAVANPGNTTNSITLTLREA